MRCPSRGVESAACYASKDRSSPFCPLLPLIPWGEVRSSDAPPASPTRTRPPCCLHGAPAPIPQEYMSLPLPRSALADGFRPSIIFSRTHSRQLSLSTQPVMCYSTAEAGTGRLLQLFTGILSLARVEETPGIRGGRDFRVP